MQRESRPTLLAASSRNARLAMTIAFSAMLFPFAGASSASEATPAAELPLVTEHDLDYVGAFRVPAGGPDPESFSYGGTALAFNPERNSLLLTGHVKHQRTAEISIPEAVSAASLEDLNTATFLQPFSDVLEGKRREINPRDPNDQRIGGYLAFDDTLIVSAYSNYDGGGTQSGSHFVRPADLSIEGAVRGPYAVGKRVHFTSAYMAAVPDRWQSVLRGSVLSGNCCRSIIAHQSHGPAVAVFDPASLAEERKVRAVQLLSYSSRRPLGPGGSRRNGLFNLTTRVDGLVFPDGTRSMLFIGRHGTGDYCYGEADECGDEAMIYKGAHAYPYIYQVWAYDAGELIPRRGFGAGPRSIEPYSTWRLRVPFETDGAHYTGGAAWDPGTDRIFFSQLGADSRNRPLIHVFRLDRRRLASSPPPQE